MEQSEREMRSLIVGRPPVGNASVERGTHAHKYTQERERHDLL